METISTIQTADMSAIERIEAERAMQRQQTVDAANAATRRAATLKSGIGIGAAGIGVGLGLLLALYGLSLVINRPSVDEIAQAFGRQVSIVHKRADALVEEMRTAANEKIEAAEKVARDSAAAAKAAEGRVQSAEAKTKAFADRFTATRSSKTVVDFTIFRTTEVGDLGVHTGWHYQNASDTAPTIQYCHVVKASVPDALQLPIAHDGMPDAFNAVQAAKAGITWDDVQRALPHCEWFNGNNPNIRTGL